MDQRVFESPDADARRGAWIAVALIGITAVIALILAALAYGRAQPAVGHWSSLPLNFTDTLLFVLYNSWLLGFCGAGGFLVNASGSLNGNTAKIIVPIFSCDGT